MPRGIQVKNLSGRDANFYRGPYIGCTYTYTAASRMLCLLKSSLLCVGGVGYAEKCQSSSQVLAAF